MSSLTVRRGPSSARAPRTPQQISGRHSRGSENHMNENSTLDEVTLARQALQESMDLRDQGHSDD